MGTFLAEVVAPRGGQLDILALENLLQAVCLTTREPVALELLGTPHVRRLLVRATTARSLAHLCAQIRAHSPQAQIRALSPLRPMTATPGTGTNDGAAALAAPSPARTSRGSWLASGSASKQAPEAHHAHETDDDPLRIGPRECVRAVVLRPRAASHLPLKLYEQRELGALGVDPLLGIFAAMDGLPPDGRLIAHLAVAAAPETWSHDLQRLAVEHPLARERAQEALMARGGL
ncbi:MAG TPA: hypothetical protein VE258_09710, partial [Ktedonobacterales bacterium]|nr:hypothetical protein [Ktedonobacterales bacterium]